MNEAVQQLPQPGFTQTVNPLMQKLRLPGTTVKLPSGGLFYDNGELREGVVDGEVHVYPMTAIDEIIMKSPDKLFSGDAVREIFSRCVPDILNVDEIFTKDIDFLIIALRKVSYGSDLDLKHDHECGTEENPSKTHTYVCSLDPFLVNAKSIDPTTVSTNFSFTLESGQTMSIRPMRYIDIITAMQSSDEDLTPEQQEIALFKTLVSMIHDVDGITDESMIIDWLTKLPALWIQKMFEKIESTSDWGAEQTVHTECKDCGEKIAIHAPINPLNFFM